MGDDMEADAPWRRGLVVRTAGISNGQLRSHHLGVADVAVLGVRGVNEAIALLPISLAGTLTDDSDGVR